MPPVRLVRSVGSLEISRRILASRTPHQAIPACLLCVDRESMVQRAKCRERGRERRRCVRRGYRVDRVTSWRRGSSTPCRRDRMVEEGKIEAGSRRGGKTFA